MPHIFVFLRKSRVFSLYPSGKAQKFGEVKAIFCVQSVDSERLFMYNIWKYKVIAGEI